MGFYSLCSLQINICACPNVLLNSSEGKSLDWDTCHFSPIRKQTEQTGTCIIKTFVYPKEIILKKKKEAMTYMY